MQSNFWAGSKNLGRHKTFWNLQKDKASESRNLLNLLNHIQIENLLWNYNQFKTEVPNFISQSMTCNDDCKHVPYVQTPLRVYALLAVLFWFYHVLSTTAQFRRFSLLKPFLTFKSHITTVLIAQNVAKASKID